MTHHDLNGRAHVAPSSTEARRLETLRGLGEEVTALLARHEKARAVERERAEMLDRIDARTQARDERTLQGLRRDLYEADRRWRAKVETLRSRAGTTNVPMCVSQPVPEVWERSSERTGGWWDDPVAAEVIEMVDGSPLRDERDVRRVRVTVARRLNHGRPGHEEYAPLVATINQMLDDAVGRIREGLPNAISGD